MNHEVKNAVLLCGSFNPVHEAHQSMIKKALSFIRNEAEVDKAYYEMSYSNCDKGTPNLEDFKTRIQQFQNINADVLITNKPLFVQKNKFIKDSFFLIGADTLSRLVDTKYY